VATLAKFEQNETLKELLLSTKKSVLGEASRDRHWGIGRTLYDPKVLDNVSWPGHNITGDVLMRVRDVLSKL
jgi:ribA/ribD-fused uncharacterized protein